MKFKDKSYRIGEIASFYGISLDAARLYDRKGIISPDKDKDNNYRYYSREDLVTMDYVFKMRRMEFSLDDIKKILNENSLLDMRDIVEAREKEIVERIEELEKKLRLIKDYRYKLDYCVKNLDRVDVVDAPNFICADIYDGMHKTLERFDKLSPETVPLLTVFPEEDFEALSEKNSALMDIKYREKHFDYKVTLEDSSDIYDKINLEDRKYFQILKPGRCVYAVGRDVTDKDYTAILNVKKFIEDNHMRPFGQPFFRLLANECSSQKSVEYMEMYQPVIE